eukprot:853958-Prorocentrum_minimum.AAC.1
MGLEDVRKLGLREEKVTYAEFKRRCLQRDITPLSCRTTTFCRVNSITNIDVCPQRAGDEQGLDTDIKPSLMHFYHWKNSTPPIFFTDARKLPKTKTNSGLLRKRARHACPEAQWAQETRPT